MRWDGEIFLFKIFSFEFFFFHDYQFEGERKSKTPTTTTCQLELTLEFFLVKNRNVVEFFTSSGKLPPLVDLQALEKSNYVISFTSFIFQDFLSCCMSCNFNFQFFYFYWHGIFLSLIFFGFFIHRIFHKIFLQIFFSKKKRLFSANGFFTRLESLTFWFLVTVRARYSLIIITAHTFFLPSCNLEKFIMLFYVFSSSLRVMHRTQESNLSR